MSRQGGPILSRMGTTGLKDNQPKNTPCTGLGPLSHITITDKLPNSTFTVKAHPHPHAPTFYSCSMQRAKYLPRWVRPNLHPQADAAPARDRRHPVTDIVVGLLFSLAAVVAASALGVSRGGPAALRFSMRRGSRSVCAFLFTSSRCVGECLAFVHTSSSCR